MSAASLVVSLLADDAASAALLEEIRVLLPSARRRTALLLCARGGEHSSEALAHLPPGTTVVVDDDPALRALAGTPRSLRIAVWCRTDEAGGAWAGGDAIVLLAATPAEAAWELVRAMTQVSDGVARGTAADQQRDDVGARAAASAAPAFTIVDGARREAGVPSAPSWATRHVDPVAHASGGVGRPVPVAASWATAGVRDHPSADEVAAPSAHPRAAEPADPPPDSSRDGGRAAESSPRFAWSPPPPPADDAASFHRAVRVVPYAEAPAELPPPPFAALAAMLPPLAPAGDPPAHPIAVDTVDRPDASLRGRCAWPKLTLFRREPAFSTATAQDARRLAEWRSTLLAVWNIKGGTGKTTLAGTIGILGAQLVEPLGGRTLVVEGNPGNPDQGTFLGVPSTAPTVRDVMRALARGASVPEGEYARDARCRVLPEPRGNPSAYSAAEVRRFVALMRGINTVIVVDLGNAAPSQAQGSREALVEHWMPHADVWVIPIDLGEASFVGAGECLDAIEEAASVRELAMPGIVVPLLLPPGGRRATRVPEIAILLNHLREVGAEVVEIPYLVEINVAQHQRRTVIGRDPRVTRAFEPLLRAVVRARQRHDGAADA
ncbi:MAG TPA: hypothetical protein VFO60_10405 [Candidatus Dormibacteraeota bacterium]|nr:hypothetical protein [Candidatus Dormibacteraeota bacterium]